MKPMIVSSSDIVGGAARAANRLFSGLLSSGIDAHMKVRIKKSDNDRVIGPNNNVLNCIGQVRSAIGTMSMRLQSTNNVNLHGCNWLPSRWARFLNSCNANVVNLHWLGGEAMSIEDIGRIQKPIVWTLHDMWAFCGAEHYTSDEDNARWRQGYTRKNRDLNSSGIDIDKLAWRRKRDCWKRQMHIVAPSTWLGECAKQSAIFSGWRVSVIPNVLDTEVYKPRERIFCRQLFGLPSEKKIILFGAIGGGQDPRKGYDLLLESLGYLYHTHDNNSEIVCAVFGQNKPAKPVSLPFPVYWLGNLNDDQTLSALYSAADVMVVPSRQENLPQTATEPQACACPVVAFNCSGMADAIEHQVTGYLAHPFDTRDMANGIQWILKTSERRRKIADAARQRALNYWSPDVVIPKYIDIYSDLIDRSIK